MTKLERCDTEHGVAIPLYTDYGEQMEKLKKLYAICTCTIQKKSGIYRSLSRILPRPYV